MHGIHKEQNKSTPTLLLHTVALLRSALLWAGPRILIFFFFFFWGKGGRGHPKIFWHFWWCCDFEMRPRIPTLLWTCAAQKGLGLCSFNGPLCLHSVWKKIWSCNFQQQQMHYSSPTNYHQSQKQSNGHDPVHVFNNYTNLDQTQLRTFWVICNCQFQLFTQLWLQNSTKNIRTWYKRAKLNKNY